ncbi:hypothetical protein HXX76_014609 [Chlamydomonas incerta]|uniref:UBC core domain-containing protein n=1 Tax=Chlamydomonas incerta TaxID=51695 RepID=A0A835SPW4_CHLIN|nr:hypothetical protein HXX76_014609 [Chlamydomonas incerta]|eukprot:KAG2424400.1 hypothetical protein HXX76_014609 [Chlamydomonas incerta]
MVNAALRAALESLRVEYSALGDASPLQGLSLEEGGVGFSVVRKGAAPVSVTICFTEIEAYPQCGALVFGPDALAPLSERFQDRGELRAVVTEVLKRLGCDAAPGAAAAGAAAGTGGGRRGSVGAGGGVVAMEEDGGDAGTDRMEVGSDGGGTAARTDGDGDDNDDDDDNWDNVPSGSDDENDGAGGAGGAGGSAAAKSEGGGSEDYAFEEQEEEDDDDDDDDDDDGGGSSDDEERDMIILCSMNVGRWERYEAALEAAALAAAEEAADSRTFTTAADRPTVLSSKQGLAAQRQIFNPREAFSMLSKELQECLRGRHPDCSVETGGDDLYHWVVDLGSFAPGCELAKDMREVSRRYCYSTVRLRLKFMRGLHPFFPPSVEVVWPHLAGPLLGAVAGHPMLVLENWDPWRPAMDTVRQIKAFLEAHARVELDNPANDIGRYPASAYTPLERSLARLEALTGLAPRCAALSAATAALYAARDSYDKDSARLMALAEGGKKRGRKETAGGGAAAGAAGGAAGGAAAGAAGGAAGAGGAAAGGGPGGRGGGRDVVWARGTGYGSGSNRSSELWDAKATEAAQRARDEEVRLLLDVMRHDLLAELGPRPPEPPEPEEAKGEQLQPGEEAEVQQQHKRGGGAEEDEEEGAAQKRGRGKKPAAGGAGGSSSGRRGGSSSRRGQIKGGSEDKGQQDKGEQKHKEEGEAAGSGAAAAGSSAGAAAGPAAMEGLEGAAAAEGGGAAAAATAAAAAEQGAGGGEAAAGAPADESPRLGLAGCADVIRSSCLLPFVARELAMASFTDMGGRTHYYTALLDLVLQLCRPGLVDLLRQPATPQAMAAAAAAGSSGAAGSAAAAAATAAAGEGTVAALFGSGLRTAARLYLNVLKPTAPGSVATGSVPVAHAAAAGSAAASTGAASSFGGAAAAGTAAAALLRPQDRAEVAAEKASREAEATQFMAHTILTVARYLERHAPAPAPAAAGAAGGAAGAHDGAAAAAGGSDAERAASGAGASTSGAGGAAAAGPEDARAAENAANAAYVAALKPLQVDAVPGLGRHHHYATNARGEPANPRPRAVRLAKEVASLESLLPLSAAGSVFVRVDEGCVQLWKALVAGPEDTPYGGGLFLFDLYFPPQYPGVPPQVHLMTTGGGRVRFNPNLYAEGKVCLSLLGTWQGDKGEQWNADVSTAVQVLISIQSLIMVPDPYFNEPGYEAQTQERGRAASREYSKNVRENNIRYAMLDMLRHPPAAFAEVVRAHFRLRRGPLLDQIKAWADETAAFDAAAAGRMTDMRRELEALIAATTATTAAAAGATTGAGGAQA